MPARRKSTKRTQPSARADRFLQNRSDGGYRYVRRVPSRFQEAAGADFVRISLHTDDLATARIRRDAQEEADNAFWSSIADGPDKAAARRYEAATARARALGFAYAPAADMAASGALVELVARLERLEALGGVNAQALDVAALLGTAPPPKVLISEAFDVYVDEIEAGQKRTKSDAQYNSWLKVKRRALNNFIAVVEADMPIDDITRADAKAFWRWWTDRIDADEVTVNTAERDFGNMRCLYREYMTWIDRPEAVNPFRNFSFGKAVKKSRPPFPTDWIRDRILKIGALAALNSEARGIVLGIVETGARPSELANLLPQQIRLDAKIPHIIIEPRGGEHRREVKADASERKIPLVGVSLAAFEAHPEGFPRYFEKTETLSATVNKFFEENGLFPSDDHSLYSLRHSFEKRMTESDIDYGLRCRLMGHKTTRPVYGDGGKLEWQAAQLKKIALPYDPAVVG